MPLPATCRRSETKSPFDPSNVASNTRLGSKSAAASSMTKLAKCRLRMRSNPNFALHCMPACGSALSRRYRRQRSVLESLIGVMIVMQFGMAVIRPIVRGLKQSKRDKEAGRRRSIKDQTTARPGDPGEIGTQKKPSEYLEQGRFGDVLTKAVPRSRPKMQVGFERSRRIETPRLGERLRIEHGCQWRRKHLRSGRHDASVLGAVSDHRLARCVADQEGQHRPEPQRFVEEVTKPGAKLFYTLLFAALDRLIEIPGY